MKRFLLAVCLLVPWASSASAQPRPPAEEFDASQELARLEQLVQRRTGTRELLDSLERMHDARVLHVLGNGNLPWSTWPISGWRWESPQGSYGRVILAIDGPYMVAIREKDKSVSMSLRDVSDLRSSQRQVGYRLPVSSANRGSVQHVDAMSVSSFSRTHRQLFQIYYYFAGPTQQVVRSDALPPSPLTDRLLK